MYVFLSEKLYSFLFEWLYVFRFEKLYVFLFEKLYASLSEKIISLSIWKNIRLPVWKVIRLSVWENYKAFFLRKWNVFLPEKLYILLSGIFRKKYVCFFGQIFEEFKRILYVLVFIMWIFRVTSILAVSAIGECNYYICPCYLWGCNKQKTANCHKIISFRHWSVKLVKAKRVKSLRWKKKGTSIPHPTQETSCKRLRSIKWKDYRLTKQPTFSY